MRRRFAPLCAVLLMIAGAGEVAAKETRVGNWLLTIETDHFARRVKGFPPPSNVIAVQMSDIGAAFALRCIGSELSMALVEPGAGVFKVGGDVLVEIRAGEGEVVKRLGTAILPTTVQIEPGAAVMDGIASAREIAFRIHAGGVTYTRVYPLRGTARVLEALGDGCVLD